MHPDNTPDNQFEQFIRRELSKGKEIPDESVWQGIAERRRLPNARLKHRRLMGQMGILLLLLGIGAGFLFWKQKPGIPQPAPAVPALPGGGLSLPQAVLPEGDRAAESSFFKPIAEPSFLAGNAAVLPAWIPRNPIPVARLVFDAGEGISYISHVSGSQVDIFPNSLVYADGSPVQGPVELYFREYRDLSAYLSSEIPMHYSDERGAFFFNSGGMFDVRVSQSGAPLYLAPGSDYIVRFVPTAELDQANLFYFSEDKGAWDYIPTNAFSAENGPPPELPRVVSEAMAVAGNIRVNSPPRACTPNIPVFPDTANRPAWVQASIRTGQSLASGENRIPQWFKRFIMEKDAFFSNAFEKSMVRLVYENDEGLRFFPEDMLGFFSELQVFKDYYFVRTGDTLPLNDKNRQEQPIEAALKKKAFWDRVEIIPDEGNKCLLVLADKEEELRLHASISISHEVRNGRTVDFEKLFAEYDRIRMSRQK